ncbi:MAG: creatininase family protein [Betaproteobacteria bacterium]|nr:creatininase family protein [Betaproteobacteria bacterium]
MHLRLDTARDLIVDLCGSLAAHEARRFYALNTGVSTLRPLKAATDELARAGVLLRYTDVLQVGGERARSVEQQAGGTHADEVETSMMLYIDPTRVDMSKAVCDYHPGHGPLTRKADGAGVFSASGVYGDATLATREKGAVVVEAMIEGMLRDIDALRALPLSRLDAA